MRFLPAIVIACCLVAACDRSPAGAAAERATSASSNATAPVAATPAIAAPATATSSASPIAGAVASQPAIDDAGSSASLAGLAHDADPDPEVLKDIFVLPGPITADTEPDGLRRIYGAANVREGEVPGAEGETEHGVILFADDPAHRAYVYFQDEKSLSRLSMVRITDDKSLWRSAQGIRIGTPLAELVRLNGGPFEFLGFDWDYGGQVSDWLGGKLASTHGVAALRVALALGDQPSTMPASKLPIGDASFRSDDPKFATMHAAVAEMSLGFPGQDDQ